MGKYSFADRAARKEPLSQEEALTMIKEAETPTLSALVSFLYLYGTRINEALRLERRDFELTEKYLKVRVPLSKKRKEGAFHFLYVPKVAPGMEPLLSYLDSLKEGKAFPISRWTARRKIHRLNPQSSPHWFRHTRASRMAENTDDILALVDWFGWADPRPAMSYIQMSGRLARRLSDKVD